MILPMTAAAESVMLAATFRWSGGQNGFDEAKAQRGNCRLRSIRPAVSNQGALYSYATLGSAPAGFEDQLPYSVGMVKLDEGPMIEAMLTDANQEDLHIGMRMEMVTRKLCDPSPNGLIIYGYKFRPVIGRKS